MGLFDKGGGQTVVTQDLTPEQRAQIRAQTDFFTSTIAPAYQQAVGGAQDEYGPGPAIGSRHRRRKTGRHRRLDCRRRHGVVEGGYRETCRRHDRDFATELE